MIKGIIASSFDGAFGNKGSLPWPKISADLKYFKNQTLANTIIIGSSTWNDPSFKSPLKGRNNIVATNNPDKLKPGYHGYITDPLIENIRSLNNKSDIYIIGGAKILDITMPIIEELDVTWVHGNYESDTIIPINKWLESFDIISEMFVDSNPLIQINKYRRKTQ